MRVFALLPLLLLPAAPAARAQGAAEPQPPPPVEAVKFNWSKERVGWERDPFAGPVENFEQMRVRARNEKRISDLKKGGSASEVSRAEVDARADAAIIDKMRGEDRPARYAFAYKASFRNHGAGATRSIDWDYVFLDAATGEELGRHRFTSDEKIGPGKSGTATVLIAAPPTRTVSVHALNSKERKGLSERVEVVRVLYADGTVWERK